MKRLVLVMAGLLAITPAAHAQRWERPVSKACNGFKLDSCLTVARAGANLIRAYGWRCDSVSAVTKFAFSRGFYMHCNRFNYSYEIRDRGGRWVVTLK